MSRAAKILASHWLSTPVLHFAGFFILCPKSTSSLRFFGFRLFKPGLKIHGNQETWIRLIFVWLLSPRYFFLQRTITEHNSVLLMGGRSRSNSVEEVTPQVPSLDAPFAIFIDLCSCDFQAIESFTAQVNNLIINA